MPPGGGGRRRVVEVGPDGLSVGSGPLPAGGPPPQVGPVPADCRLGPAGEPEVVQERLDLLAHGAQPPGFRLIVSVRGVTRWRKGRRDAVTSACVFVQCGLDEEAGQGEFPGEGVQRGEGAVGELEP